jgi:hypothetical protein
MDRTIVSLIGIVDSLDYILTTERSLSQCNSTCLASRRLQNLRHELLAEGLRHSQIVGAARDSILGTLKELQNLCIGQRQLEWVLTGLEYVEIQDVTPPPPPPPSSSGPQAVGTQSRDQSKQSPAASGVARSGNGDSKSSAIVARVAVSRRKRIESRRLGQTS